MSLTTLFLLLRGQGYGERAGMDKVSMDILEMNGMKVNECILVRQYLQDQTGICTGQGIYIFTGLYTGQNTGHHTLGQAHFWTRTKGQGQSTKQFGVDRGQRKMAKNWGYGT